MPARISSAITPHPPGSFSEERIPNGLAMSKIRNKIKPRITESHPAGTQSKVIHMPAISSITTFDGSFPHRGIILLVPMMPKTVKTTMSRIRRKLGCEKCCLIRIAGTRAPSAPMVPGAIGINPSPNPDTIHFQKSGLQLFIIIKAEVSNQIFTLEMTKCVFEFHQLTEQVMLWGKVG